MKMSTTSSRANWIINKVRDEVFDLSSIRTVSERGSASDRFDGSSSSPSNLFDLVPLSEIVNDDKSPTSSLAFPDIKRKVLADLYGLDNNHTYNYQLLKDKSPKGSVDEDIRPLVDLINSHPSFSTLSSCSGRIALFHPSYRTRSIFYGDTKDEDENDIGSDEPSGKGHGEWLLSSHSKITTEQLINTLDNAAKDHQDQNRTDIPTLLLKHEPLLLHVATANLMQARQLLHLALDIGLRESGIIYTVKRITVAIRCHSLALSSPIAYSGHLRPKDDYLDGLVKELNARFEINQQKLILLHQQIASSFFVQVPKHVPSIEDDFSQVQYEAHVQPLPDLNLWGHAAVRLLPETIESPGDVCLYVFGGYGIGPVLQDCELRKGAARSNGVYRLRRRMTQWEKYWVHIHESAWDVANELSHHETHLGKLCVKRSIFTAREGLSACVLPLFNPSLVAIFGGRESPLKPSNQLLFFDSGSNYIGFSEPFEIMGEPPSRRWGHTLTSLTGDGGDLAVVVGGRDENQILSNAYILSIESMDSDTCKLLWSKVDLDTGLYYPSVLSCSSARDSAANDIFVFGGLRSFDDPFSIFTKTHETFGAESSNHDLCISIKDRSATITKLRSHGIRFGASPCIIWRKSKMIKILFTGGFDPPIQTRTMDLNPFILRTWMIQSRELGLPLPIDIVNPETEDIDFGSLVHHVALCIPSTIYHQSSTDLSHQEIVLIGGGVPLFAFGASYAKSFSMILGPVQTRVHALPPKSTQYEKEPVDPLQVKTDVLFVHKVHAKELKTTLERCSFLDRRFRMIRACEDAPVNDPEFHVAVPVTKECLQHIFETSGTLSGHSHTLPWMKFVAGSGQQFVPFSSASLGSRKIRNR